MKHNMKHVINAVLLLALLLNCMATIGTDSKIKCSAAESSFTETGLYKSYQCSTDLDGDGKEESIYIPPVMSDSHRAFIQVNQTKYYIIISERGSVSGGGVSLLHLSDGTCIVVLHYTTDNDYTLVNILLRYVDQEMKVMQFADTTYGDAIVGCKDDVITFNKGLQPYRTGYIAFAKKYSIQNNRLKQVANPELSRETKSKTFVAARTFRGFQSTTSKKCTMTVRPNQKLKFVQIRENTKKKLVFIKMKNLSTKKVGWVEVNNANKYATPYVKNPFFAA